MRNESLEIIKEIETLIDYFQRLKQWRWNYLTDCIQIVFHDVSKLICVLDDDNSQEVLYEIIKYFVDKYLYDLIKAKVPFWLRPFLNKIIGYLCSSLSSLCLVIYKSIKSKITTEQLKNELLEVSTKRGAYIC